MTLTQSTVSGNSTAGSSAYGGGIYARVNVTLTQSTVTDNHATHVSSYGGGIYSDDSIDISGSIVAGNTAGGGNPDLPPTGSLTVGYSLIGDNGGTSLVESQTPDGAGNLIGSAAGGGIIDPLLEMLADNGGPTETHALLAGSPALDMGDPAAVAGVGDVPLYDQRGNSFDRVQNDRIDIGAFEVQSVVPSSADFDGNGFITGTDFLAWQRGFGTPAPDATKSDGDADNDLDVDGNDLDVWELQFGTAAPIVAAASALIATEPVSQPSLTSGTLADLALAMELAKDTSWEQEPWLGDQPVLADATTDTALTDRWATPQTLHLVVEDRPDPNSSADDEADVPWLSDELLEQVFG